MKKLLVIASALMLAILLAGLTAGAATASLGGVTNLYKTGCGGCHGDPSGPGADGHGTGGAVIIADTNGEIGQGTQKAGTKETYVVALVGLLPGPFGGINAAVEDGGGNKAGTMAAGLNTAAKDYKKQIVQAPPTQGRNVNGRVWTFDWTAPAVPGTYTLYAATVAANGIGSGIGAGPDATDFWFMGQYTITVTP